MKNICIIVPKGLPVPSVLGGAIETLVTSLIEENEKNKKIHITCFSKSNEQAKKISEKYKYTDCEYIGMNLNYILMAIRVKILNLFGKRLNTYNEVILRKIRNKKFDYIVAEDGAYSCFKTYLKYYKKEQLYLHYHHVGESNKLVDDTFGHFITVSNYVKNHFKETSNIKDYIVLTNGIKIENFDKNLSTLEKENIRKKLGFNNDDFVVVFCGRLVKNKGILELINSIEKIENKKIKLLIIGSVNFGTKEKSEYSIMLENKINSLTDKIKFTGYVENKNVYKYYKISDLGVLSSHIDYEDAAPLTIFEMMASSLPIVVAETGGATEHIPNSVIIVKKTENYVDDLSSAILEMYNSKELREKCSKEEKACSKKLSTSEFYNNFVKIFK